MLQSASAQAALQAAQAISNSAGAALVAGAGAALQPANGGTEIQVDRTPFSIIFKRISFPFIIFQSYDKFTHSMTKLTENGN